MQPHGYAFLLLSAQNGRRVQVQEGPQPSFSQVVCCFLFKTILTQVIESEWPL
jgi:hypothetical protein